MINILSSFLAENPKRKLALIHGAGSIGHSLVIHLLKNHSDLDIQYPFIKLAVAIQNQIIVSEAIKNGINAISFPSHPILRGVPTENTSSKKADAFDLTIFEQIITETTAVPVFYGDVGSTSSGWKVFSGDIYPAALTRRLNITRLDSVIFLTNVEGKRTGIYTKDPSFSDAKFISRIEVDADEISYFGINDEILSFQNVKTKGNFDVTNEMTGKLKNIIELAKSHTKCWVVGLKEFSTALNGEAVGTIIKPKRTHKMNIVFLGTGDAFGSGGGKSASVFVEIGDKGILLDCGPHTIQALKKSRRETNNVDIILISHFHGDHFGGIPFFLLEAGIFQRRKKPLMIIGPPEIDRKTNDLYSALYGNIAEEKLPFYCEFSVLTPSNSPLKMDGLIIRAFKMLHTPEAQGYRLEMKDLSIAYSGDTGWTDELHHLVKKTQLTISECNFLNTTHEMHLNYHQITKLASLTDRMALIHLGSEVINKIPILNTYSKIFFPLEGQEFLL
ncbi:MAG: MBL fold metallo-hydrolase [Promethearchaeota archaeon]